jgi:hypothetical protein
MHGNATVSLRCEMVMVDGRKNAKVEDWITP